MRSYFSDVFFKKSMELATVCLHDILNEFVMILHRSICEEIKSTVVRLHGNWPNRRLKHPAPQSHLEMSLGFQYLISSLLHPSNLPSTKLRQVPNSKIEGDEVLE